MRTIKFRGKDFTGSWWVGDLTHDRNGNPLISMPEYGMQVYVADESIGQFTGLHDCDGKEIYDGDIVEDGKRRGVVKWMSGKCCFQVSPGGVFLSRAVRVLGNIHDCPELLKGGGQ